MEQDNSSFWADIKTLEDQLSKSPNSFCFARLSEIYLKVGLVDDALHTARQGVAKHPEYLGGQRALAMACHARGIVDESLAALKKVTAAMPEDRQSQKLFGGLLAAAGDHDSARNAFRTVLDFFPDDEECRQELKSLDLFGGFSQPLPHADEDDSDEIIEDLEILDEIEIVEEDEQPVSDFLEQEQQLVAEPIPETHHDPLSTGTLAELYVKQGFIHKAIEIYRSILADNPGNIAVSARVAELELQDKTAFEPAPPLNEDFVVEPAESEFTVFEPDETALEEEFAVMPEISTSPELPKHEELLFDVPVENDISVLKSQGASDNVLSTLEGWLDNIRRVKTCR